MPRNRKPQASPFGNPVAVDLFCGAGGTTHGFLRAGMRVSVGVDIDPACRHAYEHNNRPARFEERDIQALSAEEVRSWFPSDSTRVLIGCAPCQPFSTYGRAHRAATKERRDERWGLLGAFGRLVERERPEIVTMENVPELSRLGHTVYEDFTRALVRLGYRVDSKVIRCSDYGVPQTRQRLVVLASRLGPISLIPPTHVDGTSVSVREAIGHLPPIEAGEMLPSDPLHRSPALSPLNLRRIRATPEGGSWPDWPMRLRAACHRRHSGVTYPSVYGRMRWDDLAPTVTTQSFGFGNGRFGHPEQDRAISLREAALLQTFPTDYEFVEPGHRSTFVEVGRHIGNAVPVRLGEAIARSIMIHLRLLSDDSVVSSGARQSYSSPP